MVRFGSSRLLAGVASKLAFLVLLSALPAIAAPADRLQDSFTGTSINSALWTVSQTAGTASESGGTLRLAPNANTGTTAILVSSASTYAMTGSQAAVKVSSVPSNAGNVNAQFSVFLNGSNYVQWFYESGSLYAFKYVGGVQTQLASFTYSSTTHAWWRIRESAGQLKWETSSDGAVYTIQASVNTSSLFSMSALKVNFYVETFGTGLSSPGQASFTNLNVAPSGTPVMSSLVDTFSGTALGSAWSINQQTQGTVAESGGSLNLSPNANTGSSQLAVLSARPYSLAGSAALVNAKQVVANGNVDNQFSVRIDASNELGWQYQQGNLYVFYVVNNVRTTINPFAYDSVQHAWWRIREAGGTVYWETAPDGITWTSHTSVADATLPPLSLLYAKLYAETFGAGLATPGTAQYAKFDYLRYFVVAGVPSSLTAGSADTFSVEVRDVFGNRVTNYTGTLRFTSSDASATLPGLYSFVTSDQGIKSFPSGVTFRTAGTQTLVATDGSTMTASSSVSVVPGVATALTLSGLPASATAGDSLQATVTAFDAYGNVATNYTGTVHFATSDPQGALPANETFLPADMGSDPICCVSLRSSGTQTVTVSDTLGGISTSSQSVTVGPGNASALQISGVGQTMAGSLLSPVVNAVDPYGNASPSYRGTIHFTSSDPQGIVPLNYTFAASDAGSRTFANGALLKSSGAQSISATDTLTSSISGTVTASVAPGPAAAFIVGTPATSTAGAGFTTFVDARDAFGNRASSYTGAVSFTSSDAQASLPGPYSFTGTDAGFKSGFSVTFKTAGAPTLTVHDTSITSSSAAVQVTPAGAQLLLVSGFPNPAIAGATGAFTVTAQDAFGNTASGYSGSVGFTSTDPCATLPAAYPFAAADAGRHSFSATLCRAGAQTISASDTSQPSIAGSQPSIQVVPGSAASFIVSGVPSLVISGAASSVTVDARDGSGNRATSYQGTVRFTSSDASATLPAGTAFASADLGLKTIPGAVLRTSGTQSLTATDGLVTGSQQGIVVQPDVPTWPAGSALAASSSNATAAHLSWTAANANSGISGYQIWKNGALLQTVSGTTLAADVTGLTAAVSTAFQIQAGNSAGNWTTNGPSATVTPLPPNPQLVAPPLDMTVATTLSDSTAFLYTGPNAIQTGVAAGTIDAKRVSVARGAVHDRAGAGIGGVQVTVLSHPELGQTWTRADGAYDLALNGGSALTLAFHKTGLLDAQRTLNAVWQEFAQVDDLVMIPQDQLVTLVDMTNITSTQVARGSVTIDEMGSRQATVLFPPGTQASLMMPDNSTQSISTLHFRATEFTVGATGPATMPAKLPPTSAYTFAVSFSADEAIAAGAKSVSFTQTVYGYVENFLAFRVGAVVPNGYYDPAQGVWVASQNGRVIKILSVTGGLADVDADGDGLADDATKLAALNFSNSERQQIATLYSAGQSLWRMPMQHFTWVDWNPSPAPLAIFAPPAGTPPAPPPSCVAEKASSIIECQTQVLGERVGVVGAPYSLNYRSSRQAGRRANYRLDLPVPAAYNFTMPSGIGCVQIAGDTTPCQYRTGYPVPISSVVYVNVAGRPYSLRNTSASPSTWKFEWDGKDAYGRTPQGEQPVKVRTCFTSPAVYYAENSDLGAAFAAIQNTGATLSWRANQSFDICNEWNGKLGGWDDRARALGGWTLSAHHAYDSRAQTLYRGDGTRTSASDVNRLVVNATIGNGLGDPAPTEGAQALSVGIGDTPGVAAGPDGSIYVAYARQYVGYEIWKMKPDGSLTLWVSTSLLGPSGHMALALGADGRLYIDDAGNGSYPSRLLRRENDGTLSTLVTLPSSNGYSPGIAIGPEGAVYFPDNTRHRVMRRGTDGSVTVVAGLPNTTVGAYSGDGGLASQAQLNSPGALAVGLDGTLYIADTNNSRVRAVGVDGIIRTFAGNGVPCGSCGYAPEYYANDGAAATQAGINAPIALAIARDGTLYISEDGGRTRRVTPDGIIGSIVKGSNFYACRWSTVDCQALAAAPSNRSLALDASGALLIRTLNGGLARISTGFTVAKSVGEQYVASSDASEIYVFDLAGRHLRTLDGLTTALVRTFGYDGAGRLISITDNSGNVTTVQRDGQGNPTAIVGPYGQNTGLSLDGNGYLASITNPNSESVHLQYKPPVGGDNHTGGLLAQLTDPRQGIHAFEFNTDGFLTKDTPPDGAYQSLDRGGILDPTHVTHTTALGRTTNYSVNFNFDNASETSSVTPPDGLTTTTVTAADHSTSATAPDGMQMTTTATPDPRFGADVLSTSSTAKTPSGLTGTLAETRTATMHSATDPLTVDTRVESLSLNGKAFTSSYNATAHTVTQATPMGRQTVLSLDSLGRVTQVQPPGVLALSVHYDTRGRPDTLTQGARVESLSYDSLGRVQTATDPLHSITLGYDAANRVKTVTLPDSSIIGAGYDASGNTTSITPPGKTAHAFSYQSGDLESNYTPPAVDGNGTGVVQTAWDLDRAVSSVTPTGVAAIVPHYDSVKARLTSVDFSARTNSFGYSASTGQLTSITAPDGVLGYIWDGPLLTSQAWTGGLVTGTISRTSYDANFWLKTETYGGQSINYNYDNDGLLTAAGSLTINRTAATGFVSDTALGSITDTHAYNSYGEEQTYAASYGGTQLYSADYGTRDGLRRIVTKTETVQGVTHTYGYGYDAQGRLTDVSIDGAATSHYGYDANGNRTVGPGFTASPTYDAQDRLTSYGNCTYGYKADGSLQTKICGTATTTYDYDAFGNLRHVTLPNATNIDYVIDGQNRRIGKKVNGVLVEGFLYRSQLKPAAWLNGDGSVRATFVYGLHANVPEYMVQGGTSYRLITDQVGSVRLVENTSTGVVAERIDYDESGNVLSDTAPGTQPFGFAGGLRDLDTSLTRFGARDYDPTVGRWTSKDPTLFGGEQTNLYEYVGGDPINFTDPTGLCIDWDKFKDCYTSVDPLISTARDHPAIGVAMGTIIGFGFPIPKVLTPFGMQPGASPFTSIPRLLNIAGGRFVPSWVVKNASRYLFVPALTAYSVVAAGVGIACLAAASE